MTTRTTTTKTNLVHRLNRLAGQMLALKRMVDGDRYCIDIITQTSAIRHGLSKVEDMLLADHLAHCARDQMATGHVEKATKEILKVYKLQRT